MKRRRVDAAEHAAFVRERLRVRLAEQGWIDIAGRFDGKITPSPGNFVRSCVGQTLWTRCRVYLDRRNDLKRGEVWCPSWLVVLLENGGASLLPRALHRFVREGLRCSDAARAIESAVYLNREGTLEHHVDRLYKTLNALFPAPKRPRGRAPRAKR